MSENQRNITSFKQYQERSKSLDKQKDEQTFTQKQFLEYDALISSLYSCLNRNDGFDSFFTVFSTHFKADMLSILGINKQPLCVLLRLPRRFLAELYQFRSDKKRRGNKTLLFYRAAPIRFILEGRPYD